MTDSFLTPGTVVSVMVTSDDPGGWVDPPDRVYAVMQVRRSFGDD